MFLGRIQPDFFPHIFGPTENQPLDYEASANAFRKLTSEINVFLEAQATANGEMAKEMTPEQVALGFLRVANEAMCRPIRALTQVQHDLESTY